MVSVGTLIDGFCAGLFGRDSYSQKRVEALGADWVVARNTEGYPEFAVLDSPDELDRFVEVDA